MAAVLQPERALRQQQGHLKGDAVVAIVPVGRLFGHAQGVVYVSAGDSALGTLVHGCPVVVQDGDAGDCEQGAEGERLRPEWEAAQRG